MKKTYYVLTILLIVMLGAAGCSYDVPDMTDEQQALITEYAAGIVLKHDANFKSKLTLGEIEESMPTPTPTPVPTKKPEQEETDKSGESGKSNEPAETPVSERHDDLAEFAGLSDVAINYTGYSIEDMYPDVMSGAALGVKPASGYKLAVFHFDMINTIDKEISVDFLSKKIKASITADGRKKTALTTFLDDDMLVYQGSVKKEVVPLVVIIELPEDAASKIEHAVIELSRDGAKAINSLF